MRTPPKVIMLTRAFSIIAITSLVMLSLSCKPPAAATGKRYTVKGKVLEVDKTEHTATLSFVLPHLPE